MLLKSWLQNVRSALAPRRGQRHHRRRGSLRAATHRPNLEVLEDRLTPSFTLASVPWDQYPWYPQVVFAPPPPQLADFTSDGILDQIDTGRNVVVVRPGRGDGTFADPIYSNAYAWPGYLLAVADFNDDGRLDVFTITTPGTGDSGAFGSVLLGRGDGTFPSLEYFGVADGPQGIGIGDINGDGRPDVVVPGTDLGGESVFVELLNDGNWEWGPYLFFSVATVTEGNTGTTNATFTLSLAYASNVDLTVNYHTADGSATAGSDYQAASGTLTIPAGQTTGTITVQVNGDSLSEPNETFFVYLSQEHWSGVTIGYGTGTIVDDEPRISIGDATVTEGNTGTASASFTVMLDAASAETITVAYATGNGTGTAGSDYQAASGTLTFAPGETSKTITVLVNGDRLAEPDETFVVNLSSPTNATIGDAQGVGTILDDEPRISINNVSKAEGKNLKTTLFTFTVALSAAYDQPVTMSFRTVDGSAKTSDQDYVAKTGTLTFNPGETTKSVTIVVNGDSKKEANETFYLDLFGNSSNSLFTKNRGIGTILNDD